jgi:hypothetical protein
MSDVSHVVKALTVEGVPMQQVLAILQITRGEYARGMIKLTVQRLVAARVEDPKRPKDAQAVAQADEAIVTQQRSLDEIDKMIAELKPLADKELDKAKMAPEKG